MSEAIKLNGTDKKKWNEVRINAVNELIQRMNYNPTKVWQKAVVFKGISRLVDEKFNTASNKLLAIEKGAKYIIETIEQTGYSTSQKTTLVNDILTSSDLFTKDMLLKLSTKELQTLKEKIIG